MDRQHPSDSLIKDTIKKAENLTGQSIKITRKKTYKLALAIAAAVVFCLLTGSIWKQNFQIVYTDLNNITISDNSKPLPNEKNVGEIKQSYLGNSETFHFIFDENAANSEIKTKHGKINIQTGSVMNSGIQELYETKPKQVKRHKVYLGKCKTGNDEILLAAFVKDGKQYYLEGTNVTEKEMTTAIKELLK